MISLDLAKRLKDAGLVWHAGVNDFFAIPDRDMDDRVFVISDLMANLGIFRGWPVVTFHGTAEWALDYILSAEVVWLPREEQLRETILNALPGEELQALRLEFNGQNYRCQLVLENETIFGEAPSSAAAYGQVLLQLLERDAHKPSGG